MTTTPSNPRAAAAATLALALALAPHLASAQSSADAPLPTWHDRVEPYTGGPIPAGAHRERQPNGYIMTGGAVLFGAGYLPWAIQGLGDTGQSPQTNSERGSIYRVIPFAGPFIANLVYDQHQRDDCAAFMAMAPTMPPTQTTACTDQHANMFDSTAHPLPTQYVPTLSSGGDWVWAFTQFGAQAVGLGLFIWGLIGRDVLVYDDPHAQASARRDHRGAWNWSLAPGVAGAPVGLTLAATQF